MLNTPTNTLRTASRYSTSGQPAGITDVVGHGGDAVDRGGPCRRVGVVAVGDLIDEVDRIEHLDDALGRLPRHGKMSVTAFTAAPPMPCCT
jgi:hypothetical protein